MKKVLITIALLMSVSFGSDLSGLIKPLSDKCDNSDLNACYKLGSFYSNGIGIMQDTKQAFALYTKACDGGIAWACHDLGIFYENGTSVRQNYKTAKDLYGKACDLGVQSGCDYYKSLNVKVN